MFLLTVSGQMLKGNRTLFLLLVCLFVTSAATAEKGKNGMFFWGFSKDSNVPGCMKSYICEGDTKSNWAKGFAGTLRCRICSESDLDWVPTDFFCFFLFLVFFVFPSRWQQCVEGKEVYLENDRRALDLMDPRGHRVKSVLSTLFILLISMFTENNNNNNNVKQKWWSSLQ